MQRGATLPLPSRWVSTKGCSNTCGQPTLFAFESGKRLQNTPLWAATRSEKVTEKPTLRCPVARKRHPPLARPGIHRTQPTPSQIVMDNGFWHLPTCRQVAVLESFRSTPDKRAWTQDNAGCLAPPRQVLQRELSAVDIAFLDLCQESAALSNANGASAGSRALLACISRRDNRCISCLRKP